MSFDLKKYSESFLRKHITNDWKPVDISKTSLLVPHKVMLAAHADLCGHLPWCAYMGHRFVVVTDVRGHKGGWVARPGSNKVLEFLFFNYKYHPSNDFGKGEFNPDLWEYSEGFANEVL